MNLRSTVLICLHLAACVASTQNHILRAGPRDKTYAVLDKVDSVLDKELDLLLHDSESPTTQLQSMQPRFTSTDNEDVVGDKATAIVTDGTDENAAFNKYTYSTCQEMTGDPSYTQPKPHYSNNDIEIGIGTEMCCYEFVLYIIDQSNKQNIPQATNGFNVAMQEHGDKKHWWITKTLEILLGKGFKSKCPVNDKDCLAKHRVWRAMLSTLSLQKTDCGDFSEPSLLVVDEIKDVGKYPGHYGITGSSQGAENIIHFRNEKGPEKSDGDGFSTKKKSKRSTGTLCYKIRALDKLINIDPDLSINGYTPDVADVVDKLTTEAIVDEKLEE